MASELQEQRMLNSELVRVCSRQQQIIEQQSQMIVEMLEQMGRWMKKNVRQRRKNEKKSQMGTLKFIYYLLTQKYWELV